ncbi:hypothetical protein UCDDA912_g00249 [Diaporthe ampelina]|uniref:Amidoligase enzyme n=1 Tax=Diaporthe ampelina TaxID=1214573 RepID=A0A0G2HYK3_9PEZI|nr:hypothetical protein UCDDA912_g00249 [Diaporthe ampelina]
MYKWVGVEIRSPALVAEAGSFDEIKRVVTLLRNKFRLRLNDTTGFHVHVGMGAHKLPSRTIRRLAQLLWGFLEQGLLHPHEVGMATLEPSESCTSVVDGLSVLCQQEMYAETARAVNELSGYIGQRFNYNLLAYEFQDLGDLEIRRTVEFREAAGSLDPPWVAAWSRICSRIVEFCLEATEGVFVDVLMRVVEAELAFEVSGEEMRYDVVDLLNDLGLRDEAKLVEKILMGDRDAFWFPCALEENSSGDATGASIMVAPGSES